MWLRPRRYGIPRYCEGAGAVRDLRRAEFPALAAVHPKNRWGRIATANVFGMHLPFSVLSFSGPVAGTFEGSRIKGTEALASGGLPSAGRASPEMPVPPEERDDRDKQEEEEKR
jgi:hypothetical protein